MASFYEDASLVVIPSGYKTSKIYAEKPTDGSGDLTFTRASDATRVGSNGLIEEVRTNLVLQSEAFNTTWAAARGSVTANATTAPNGTTTADKFVADTQASSHFVSQTISGLTSGGIYTSSVYAKAAEWNSIAIFRGDSAIGVSFRLDTQATTILNGTPTTFSITSVGNGWFRCSVSFAIASTSDSAQVRVGNDGAYSIVGNNVNGVFLWGAQYEVSDFGATNYIPTTTAAVSVGPVNNVPRLDYTNSSCPRLLLEPQRTNLFTFSENFGTGTFFAVTSGAATATFTSNFGIAPDGYQGADRIQLALNGASSTAWIRSFTVTAGVTYTYSIYLKSLSGTPTIFFFNDGAANISRTLTTDWVRYQYTWTASSTGVFPRFSLSTATSSTADVLAWGAQVEAGAYATSYIPTLAATVTRVADAASKTGISSLIGQTEGAIFLDVRAVLDSTTNQDYSVSDGTTNNRALIRLNNSGLINAIGVFGGSVEFNMGTTAYTTGSRYKIALAYKLNDIALYVNGVQAATDNTATISGTLSRFGFDVGTGVAPIISPVNQALVFKTRLTNAQLAELTTL